jgi:hypothetical protein
VTARLCFKGHWIPIRIKGKIPQNPLTQGVQEICTLPNLLPLSSFSECIGETLGVLPGCRGTDRWAFSLHQWNPRGQSFQPNWPCRNRPLCQKSVNWKPTCKITYFPKSNKQEGKFTNLLFYFLDASASHPASASYKLYRWTEHSTTSSFSELILS